MLISSLKNRFGRATRLFFLGVIFTFIAGCSAPEGRQETNTPAISDQLATETVSQPPSKAAEPAPPTAQPTASLTLPATNTPLPTLTPAETSTVEVIAGAPLTATTALSPTTGLTTTLTPGTEEPSALAIDPAAVNGIPVEQIIVLDEGVAQNVRDIYARGQALGRDGSAFSKLGDSLIATPSFLTQFDTGVYDLGPYTHLQSAIDYFTGSYERYGVALRPGLHAWGVFDPLWANKDWCQANEDLLSCEIRLHNPGLLLILLGTNDAGNPPGFDYNMRKVVEFVIEKGIIPVIVTKADRFEGPDNINNEILRQIAADFQVPLWDFDLVAETIPDRGLTDDLVHLTMFPENDFSLPEAYLTGHGVHNLTGLMALERVRQVLAR